MLGGVSLSCAPPFRTIVINPTPLPPPARRFVRRQPTRGMTLVEVMIASLLFAIMAIGVTGVMIQNLRFATKQSYRTQVIAESIGVIDQLRLQNYNAVNNAYNTYVSDHVVPQFPVQFLDPSKIVSTGDTEDTEVYAATTNFVPDGYRVENLKVNAIDGTATGAPWNAGIKIAMDFNPDATHAAGKSGEEIAGAAAAAVAQAPDIQVDYWLTLKRNESVTAAPYHSVYEMVLLYRWKEPGNPGDDYQYGNLRLALPKPYTAPTASATSS
jgi:prepilin-type N-terminal cleavage/methylation domain-containing protein